MTRMHHETLAPSSIPAILQCACFEGRGDRKIGAEDDEYANLGNELHALTLALACGNPAPETKILEKGDREDCEDTARKIKELLSVYAPGIEPKIEVRVELLDNDLNVITFGHADLVAMPLVLDIKSGLDFKTDYGKHGAQLDAYSLALMREHNFDKVIQAIAFIKTRKVFAIGRSYDQCAATVQCAIERINNLDRFPQPCEWCRYCANILCCPGVNERIAMVERVWAEVPKAEKLMMPETIEDPLEMSAVLACAKTTMKQYVKAIEGVIKRIEETALAFSEEHDIPDFIKVTKAGKREILDLPKAFALSGLEEKNFYRGLNVSLPKLSAAFADQFGLSEASARKELETRLQEVITYSDPTISLEFKPDLNPKRKRMTKNRA